MSDPLPVPAFGLTDNVPPTVRRFSWRRQNRPVQVSENFFTVLKSRGST